MSIMRPKRPRWEDRPVEIKTKFLKCISDLISTEKADLESSQNIKIIQVISRKER